MKEKEPPYRRSQGNRGVESEVGFRKYGLKDAVARYRETGTFERRAGSGRPGKLVEENKEKSAEMDKQNKQAQHPGDCERDEPVAHHGS